MNPLRMKISLTIGVVVLGGWLMYAAGKPLTPEIELARHYASVLCDGQPVESLHDLVWQDGHEDVASVRHVVEGWQRYFANNCEWMIQSFRVMDRAPNPRTNPDIAAIFVVPLHVRNRTGATPPVQMSFPVVKTVAGDYKIIADNLTTLDSPVTVGQWGTLFASEGSDLDIGQARVFSASRVRSDDRQYDWLRVTIEFKAKMPWQRIKVRLKYNEGLNQPGNPLSLLSGYQDASSSQEIAQIQSADESVQTFWFPIDPDKPLPEPVLVAVNVSLTDGDQAPLDNLFEVTVGV